MLTPNVRGVLWMLAAVIALTAMFAVAKHLTRGLPVLEVALFRMLAALLFYLPWLMHHGIGIMRTERIKMHFIRGFFGATSLFCMVYAVGNLILANATVLGFTIPLWSIVLAALFLGERVRLRRTVATIVGFMGVVVVVQPGTLGLVVAGAIMGGVANPIYAVLLAYTNDYLDQSDMAAASAATATSTAAPPQRHSEQTSMNLSGVAMTSGPRRQRIVTSP